jgi:hypothetical protein
MTIRQTPSRALSTAALVAVTQAAGPTHSVETIDFTNPAHPPTSEACGFPVSLHVFGTWNVVTWTDADGNVTKELRNYRFRGELTANGVTVQGISRGPETTTFHPDGSYTVEVHGIVNRRAPGLGTVTLASGLTVTHVDGENEVELFQSGPDDEDISELCAAFTG